MGGSPAHWRGTGPHHRVSAALSLLCKASGEALCAEQLRAGAFTPFLLTPFILY